MYIYTTEVMVCQLCCKLYIQRSYFLNPYPYYVHAYLIKFVNIQNKVKVMFRLEVREMKENV